MHLAWSWFTGLGFDQEIPHHSTFSKNRTGGLRSRSCSRSCLNRSCASVEAGLVQGKHLSVDGSFVEANAAKESRIHGAVSRSSTVNQTLRQCLTGTSAPWRFCCVHQDWRKVWFTCCCFG